MLADRGLHERGGAKSAWSRAMASTETSSSRHPQPRPPSWATWRLTPWGLKLIESNIYKYCTEEEQKFRTEIFPFCIMFEVQKSFLLTILIWKSQLCYIIFYAPGVIGIGQEEPPPGPPWLRLEVMDPMNMFLRVAPMEVRLPATSPRCADGPPLKPAAGNWNCFSKLTFSLQDRSGLWMDKLMLGFSELRADTRVSGLGDRNSDLELKRYVWSSMKSNSKLSKDDPCLKRNEKY